MHEIVITGEEKLNITVSIDGQAIRFSRKGNPEAIYSAPMISEDLDRLLHAVSSLLPLHTVPFHLAGTNVIRMIDEFCLEEALQAWKHYADDEMDAYCNVREKLYQFLGFAISSHLVNSPFCMEAKRVGAACKQEKLSLILHDDHYFDKSDKIQYRSLKGQKARTIQRQESYEADGVRVEFSGQDGIQCVFLVNGILVSIPLSRSGCLITPQKLHAAAIETRESLVEGNADHLNKLVSEYSGRTILAIMIALHHSELEAYLTHVFREYCREHRQLPAPRKIIKSIFHCSVDNLPGADDLLGALERLIPEASQYLLDSSYEEIRSDKDEWILFRPSPGKNDQFTLRFDFGATLNQEVRDYLRAASYTRVKSNVPVATFTYDKWFLIQHSLKAFKQLGIHIDSILALSPSDCLALQSYFAQSSALSTKTQRSSLLEMKLFYRYIADQQGIVGKNPFEYVRFPKKGESKHKPPITKEALIAIEERITQLPMCYRLAFCVAVFTAARASSICSLTPDAIIKENGMFYLVINHHKTAITHTTHNRPTTTKYTIDQDFAIALQKFINETEDLRKQLGTPYIFVYQNTNFRNGSERKPSVITHSEFSRRLCALLDDIPLFHTDGTPVRCNFMSIRAEVGRAMFAQGKTADDVARMLGNTPQVAATHYNTMDAHEEANLYNEHYNAAFANMRAQIEMRHNVSAYAASSPAKSSSRPVMYGTCGSDNNKYCNSNECDRCRQRIVCRNNNRH